ncbi:uncharacterized protein LOC113321528 [Papaver somniferum]|uniref:uncharacterized protein LOC113321528 n=1 Tax=Papaver somniferum TaxID=3469 RepID=UPI000E700495|nr:uncharacterized protein LOC113321528 [Papaver somniferum]
MKCDCLMFTLFLLQHHLFFISCVKQKRKDGFEEGDIQTFYDTHTYTNKKTSEVVSISDEARIKWDRMNERMQQGSEAGATPPTEAELCAQVLKKKQRRCRFATTVSNNEGIREMLQAHADRIQAQEEQIRAQNEVIKKIKEDSEKVIRNMQVMMIRSLGLNNITANELNNINALVLVFFFLVVMFIYW